MTKITIVDKGTTDLEAHKPGCRDISKKQMFSSEPWTIDVKSQMDAYAEYNNDFIYESGWDGQYHIRFMPCCPVLPEWDDESLKMAHENGGTNLPALDNLVSFEVETVQDLVESPEPTTEIKVGRKWTYIYVDGELVAEVRNDQYELVRSLVGFTA